MARYEPRVSCITIKKISKIKNISQFGLKQMLEIESREKKASFSENFTRYCPSELGRPRVKAALRDESYAWVPESQDFPRFKVSVFTKTEKRRCPWKSRCLRYGFSPTWFNLCLRASVCVCVQGKCCLVFPFDPMTGFWP